jgi:hypothetical protein
LFAARADVHRARVSVAPSPRDRRARVVDVFSLIPIVHAVRALAALARGRRPSPQRARRPPARRVVASRRARAFGAGATARIADRGRASLGRRAVAVASPRRPLRAVKVDAGRRPEKVAPGRTEPARAPDPRGGRGKSSSTSFVV